jgi:hypothetical protein
MEAEVDMISCLVLIVIGAMKQKRCNEHKKQRDPSQS